MKLSINYSPQAAELLSQGRINLDFFKSPDWPHLIAEARKYAPVAVHFSLGVGNGNMEAETDWDLVERLLSETITPYVNTHIDPSPERYLGLIVDKPTEAQAAEIVENTAKDLKCLVDHFGASMVIAENSPYHADKGRVIRTAVEPDVITKLIEEAGCGLLLDLSHARISARYLGMDEWEYLEKLPLQRLREMHFTGIRRMDGRLVDHLGALPEDWLALKKAMELIHTGRWGQPWMLAFEYGGVGEPFALRSESGVMAEQMPVLWEIVKS